MRAPSSGSPGSAADAGGGAVPWRRFADEAPDLAGAVRDRLLAARHHVLATLRRDGSPRVSGTEVDFHGPDLVLGSLWGAVKAQDLRRDGRFAVHANPGDGSMRGGDAKVAGRAVEVRDPAELRAFVAAARPLEPFQLFRLLLTQAVLTTPAADGQHILVESWWPGSPVVRFARFPSYPPRRLDDQDPAPRG
ncbi:pyridoxamine 5'-phosphate oxidase family protein [Streptoalloteichus hindustanus]|nr:pyridoxamine 5'-phosphate oxidase family protein [Streptoalloteichus hindustanus]